METIGFVLITDENYLPYSLFAASAIKTRRPDVKKVLILVNCLDKKAKLSVIARELQLTLVFAEETTEFFRLSKEMKLLNISDKRHVTSTTYFKLSIIQYFKSQFDRIVYLDIDLLLIGDLDELCNMDLMGFPIGAIKDLRGSQLAKKIHVKQYFNAGLLVIDLNHAKIEALGKILRSRLREAKNLNYQDQDVLNLVFNDYWFEMPKKYNYQIAFRHPIKNHNVESIVVVHFVGPLKPWKVSLGRHHQMWESNYRIFQNAHQNFIPTITPKQPSFGFRILAAVSTIPLANILPTWIRIVLVNFLSKKFWWK